MSDEDEGPLQYDIPDDVLGPERTLLHAFNLWINPEVHRRAKAGLIKIPMRLDFAQVLFRPGHQAPEVRLNDEVRGNAEVDSAQPLVPGKPVYRHEVIALKRFELTDEDADAGHLTIVKMNDRWQMFFDFQQNRNSAAALVTTAEQFATTAELALGQGLQAPFIDNLFNASELLAQARLIRTLAEPPAKTHRTVGSRINLLAKQGNVDQRFIELFNELSRVRVLARYRGAIPELKSDDPIGRVKAEIAELRERLKRFSDYPI